MQPKKQRILFSEEDQDEPSENISLIKSDKSTNYYYWYSPFIWVVIYLFTFILSYNHIALINDRPISWDKLIDQFFIDKASGKDIFTYNTLEYDIPDQPNFSTDLAYRHLLRLGLSIHSYNTNAIDQVERYLLSFIRVLQERYPDLKIDFDRRTQFISDEKVNKLSGTSQTIPVYFEASNILVFVPGTDTKNNSTLLLSAHYDSQSTSHGASDNGISVAVLLEALRLRTMRSCRNNLLFNFNSGEEKGLMGAKALLRHPWRNTNIKGFINLEASGSGGRALLFQSNHSLINMAFGNAPYPHGSVVGNDAFQAGVLNSRTDYQVYHQDGMYGVDMATYAHRSIYHTPEDDLKRIYPNSLHRFGTSVNKAIADLSQSPAFAVFDPEKTETPIIFFDILGLVLLTPTAQQMRSIIIISILFHLLVLLRVQRRGISLLKSLGEQLVFLVFFIILSVFTIAAWVQIQGGMYGHGFHILIYLCYGIMGWGCGSLGYTSFLQAARAQSLLLYIPLLSLQLFALNNNFAGLYFLLIISSAHIIAVLIPMLRQMCYIGLLFIIHGFSSTFLLSLSQGVPTGSPKFLTYGSTSILGLLSSLNLPKYTPRVGLLLVASSILGMTLISTQSPLSKQAPIALHFEQHFCLTPELGCIEMPKSNSSSLIRIIGPSGIQWPNITNVLETKKKHSKTLDQHIYLADPPHGFSKPLINIIDATLSYHDENQFQIKLDAYESRICHLRLDVNLTRMSITTSSDGVMLDTSLVDPPTRSILMMRRNSSTPYTINFTTELPKIDQLRFGVWCGYDTVQNDLPPGLSHIRDSLPEGWELSTAQAASLMIHSEYVIPLNS